MAYSAISKSSSNFNTINYTGTGSSLALTGVGFQPDMIWQKVKSTTSSHRLTDAIRGTGYIVYPNDTAEQSAENAVTAFGTDGFTVGTGNGDAYNANGATYVAWNWKANGSGSANSDGSTSSTVSANTVAGFSIVQHTGSGGATTIGHGLGVAPTIVLTKRTNSSNPWIFQQNIIGGSFTSSNYLILNTTAVAASSSNLVNSVTSSTLSLAGSDDWVNGSGDTYIHYVFAEKEGYSKFGSYVGNGAISGPFIYTGFKPAFVLIKKATGSTDGWFINDNTRSSSGGPNPNSYYMRPNTNEAQGTSSSLSMDTLSNGFKIKNTDTAYNNDNSTYFYMAFGQPIVSTNGDIATAR